MSGIIAAFANTTAVDDEGLKAPAHGYCVERYVSRFGDVCCVAHDMPLAWAPSLVRPGIYGDNTEAWVKAQRKYYTTAVQLCANTYMVTSDCDRCS